MENEVSSQPNDKIAIVCKCHDNENNTFIIIPTSVALGKVDEDLVFHSENDEYHLFPIDRAEFIKNPKLEYFYVYCDSLDNLCKEYNEKDANKVMMQYYTDIASQLNLALVDEDTVKIYHQDYRAISEEIDGKLSKCYKEVPKDKRNSEVHINKKGYLPTEVDLERIDKNDLANHLKRHIFENDSIIDDIATIIAMNYSAKYREEIVSMLSIGKTGCGKTETYRLISEYLGVPFTMFDCSSMSKTGYQGNSIEDLIKAIYQNGKDKPILIPKSIVVLEEIDKIANRGHLISELGVQFELLKFLDGFQYQTTLNRNQGLSQEITVDSTFMTKAALGAFEELFEQKKREAFGMGFNKGTSGAIKISDVDINKYGLSGQLIRRFLLTFLYKDLMKDDLLHILTESESSPLLIKKRRYLREFNTILEYTTDYLEAVVDYAETIKSGASGLKKGVVKSLLKADAAVYDRSLSQDKSVKRLQVTAETFENPCKFTY